MQESHRIETRFRSSWTSGMVMVGLLTLFPIAAGAETARWDIDPDHSAIEFRVAHMVVSKTSGRFTDYQGFVEMDADTKALKSIEATIKAGSIDTNHDKRDAHLRNADFLDVEQFPTMTYKMSQYQKQGDTYTIIGDLTLRGVTKQVTLSATFNGVTKDPWGNTRAGFSADGTLNRKDFGMVWNKVLDSGGLVVGDEVHIHLDIECIKAQAS
ncbi:MAG: YceI family protein [Nitrospira sp.]|nr:YceI family protein [Nitrospira sp.]MDH4242267.1 YceI family protein [Nitrospira sp.]MDH4354612.1 YceI family protein [Nitrospira sp.]MDH5317639.1 YceI family protein [Nitrospira sp.]